MNFMNVRPNNLIFGKNHPIFLGTGHEGKLDGHHPGRPFGCHHQFQDLASLYRYAPGYTGLPGDIAPDVKGDMDGDSSLTLADLIIVLRICAGEKVSPKTALSVADVNDDDKIGQTEAVYILLEISGMR